MDKSPGPGSVGKRGRIACLLLLVVALLVTAAVTAALTTPLPRMPPEVPCATPRPAVCTQVYDPVCATRDTGIRCITTPCDSSERVTYPNACTACADPNVYSYVMGACGG